MSCSATRRATKASSPSWLECPVPRAGAVFASSKKPALIEGQVALLNPKEAGFNIQVLLLVAMTEHTDENRHGFERHVALLPEVTECFSVSGDRDYVLHVVVKDMDSYTDFLNGQILKHPAVRSASSTFVLRRVKYTTELPV